MTPQQTTVYVPVDVKDEEIEKLYYINGVGKFVKPITGYFLKPEEMEEVIRETREQAIREAAENKQDIQEDFEDEEETGLFYECSICGGENGSHVGYNCPNDDSPYASLLKDGYD